MRVLVLGAGIVGASATYHLAREGAQVTVVDPAPAGRRQGVGAATPAGAGIVFPWQFPNAPAGLQELGRAAVDSINVLVAQLADVGVHECGYLRHGALTVSEDRAEVEALAAGARWLRDQPGVAGLGDIELLDSGGPARRVPLLREDLGGVSVEGAAQVDGAVLRDALLQAAAQHGAQYRSGSAALAIDRDRVLGAQVGDEVLPADTVIVAAGAWSAGLCAPLGVQVPVAPQRGLTVHVEVSDVATDGWPAVRGPGNAYLVAFPGGRVAIGASVEPDAGFDASIGIGALQRVLDTATAIAPGLARGHVRSVLVGLRPVTPDGLPVLGVVRPGLLLATGLGSQGLTYGPYVGGVVARLALGQPVGLNLARFRADRAAGAR